MQQVVFDAKVTEWFTIDKIGKDEKSTEKASEEG